MAQSRYGCLRVAAVAGALLYAAASAQAPQPGASAPNRNPPQDSSQQIADRIINSKIPVLVDCWAPWCGPCRMLLPILKEIEQQYAGRILVMRVNVDIHRALAGSLGVSGIPAVFIVRERTVLSAITGLHPKQDYIDAIEQVLASSKPSPPKKASARKPDSTASGYDTTRAAAPPQQ